MQKKELYEKGKTFGINQINIDKIIQKTTNYSKSQLFLTNEIDDIFGKEIIKNFLRIQKGEPIEYIINQAEFYSLDFYVDNKVLIPRNETELIVDKTIDTIVNFENITLIDIGTGSSCIPISIIKNTQKIKNCYVSDISRKALEVSKINILKHHLEKKITQIKSNLFQKFLGNNEYNFTNNIIITANLPYVKNRDFINMDLETFFYEPNIALFGGKETGFELYKNLIRECILFKNLNKNKNIFLFIEIGFDQYELSKLFLKEMNLKYIYYKDNNNIQRCIKITF